jgi:Tfp pilus assembly protein PilO
MLDATNVWVKKSTGQRYCKACRKDKRQKDYQAEKQVNQGFFAFGTLWNFDQIRLATLPQIRTQKETIEKKVGKLAESLSEHQEQLRLVTAAWQAHIDKIYDDVKPIRPITDDDDGGNL